MEWNLTNLPNVATANITFSQSEPGPGFDGCRNKGKWIARRTLRNLRIYGVVQVQKRRILLAGMRTKLNTSLFPSFDRSPREYSPLQKCPRFFDRLGQKIRIENTTLHLLTLTPITYCTVGRVSSLTTTTKKANTMPTHYAKILSVPTSLHSPGD